MKVVVEADGGSRGNPGPAGYGAVVRDASNGELLAERSEGIGVATNNVAEYGGLIAGLQAAASLAADEVEVRMDSKLVVEQMSGRWKIKHPALQPLAAQARELVGKFSRVTFEWIPRERNKEADRLANEAMDAQAAHTSTPAKWTGAQGTPTRILLLRHGQTPLSVERRYSGRGEAPLTPLGEKQALGAATRLASMSIVDSSTPIISSPLGRAKQTAQAVADATGGTVTVHNGLTETDFGTWEGLTFAEAAERDPELHGRWIQDSSVQAPSGESFDEVHRRVRKVRDSLVEQHGGETVIVVSHVTPIKSLLRLGLDAGPSLLFRLHLDLASLSIVEFYPDGNASVRLVNDISHYQGLS
ncbi:bifunctional RNase H/acid phosphatase [Kibdelosporangium philippinense]|uniref:Bifunctional RNase H/acid phosphatase n=1 Tax=Kibdelosporangium philippinense TaxID=211113 RepID=A0ABS8ZLA0_9PSEU|nr:bifunctional RNase H/acid phosphatase [Kibdelosporangium philippinense]MCE7008342.1 bifunctional RNase H/acid phosphatase [Kibdelosporangium philippinense]